MFKKIVSKANIYTRNFQKIMPHKTWRSFCEGLSRKEKIRMGLEEHFEGKLKEFDNYTVYEDKLLSIYHQINSQTGSTNA